MQHSLHALAPLWLLAGCATAEGAGDQFAIDTLPSGVVRVTSEAPNGWRDSARAWRIEETGRFAGEEGTEGMLVEPQSLAVDPAGRVYVADRTPATIKVFGAGGALLRTIGRDGEGPGEFRVAFIAVWRDRLVVHDPQQSRTSVFDTSGTFLTSWRSACCYWTDIGVDTAGLIYIASPEFGPDVDGKPAQPWIRYRMDGSLVDTLRLPPWKDEGKTWTVRAGMGENQMEMAMGVPYTPERRWTLHPHGGFVLGWPGAYDLVRSPAGQDTALLFGRAWTPEPVPEALRVAAIETNIKSLGGRFSESELRSVFRLDDVPALAPAFMGLAVDGDGNTWARQLVGSDSTRTTWDVFDGRGVWLGPVTAPAEIPDNGARVFGRDVIYAAIEDELGRPVIARFRIVR